MCGAHLCARCGRANSRSPLFVSVHSAGGATQNYTQQYRDARAQTYTDKNNYRSDRARKYKYKNEYRSARTNIHIQNKNKYRDARAKIQIRTQKHTHRNDAVRVGTGRLRENAVPRHWACHVPNVDYRAFATHVQNVFGSLRFFLDERTNPHRRGLEQMLTTLRPWWSCAPAPLVLRTPTCPERRQVRCCGTQLHFAKLLLRRCQSERMMPDRNRFFLFTTTPCFCPLPFVLLHLFCQSQNFTSRHKQWPYFFFL